MHNCDNCKCNISAPSTQQTLDELSFSRGIWTSALNGCKDEVVNFLDIKHVSPDVVDSSGYTALHYCCRNGHTDICHLLLQRSANPNIQTKSGGVTALHRAAYSGHAEIVKLLLVAGANSVLEDSDGKIPLHKAVERKHTEVVRILVSSSPESVSLKDNRGRMPRDCVVGGSDELMKLLEQVPST